MQNLKENWLLAWKMTKGIWLIFMRAVKTLKITSLIGSFLSKVYIFSDEKLQKSYLHWRWRVMQSLKKNWLLVLMVNSHASSSKSENPHFDVLLLLTAYKVSANKIRKSYLSWHWRVIQILKKNWLFVWKRTWGIWWILTGAVESLKICTLMGYFRQKNVMLDLKIYKQYVSWKMI